MVKIKLCMIKNSIYAMGRNMQTSSGGTHALLPNDFPGERMTVMFRCILKKQQNGDIDILAEKDNITNIGKTAGNFVWKGFYSKGDELYNEQLNIINLGDGEDIYKYKSTTPHHNRIAMCISIVDNKSLCNIRNYNGFNTIHTTADNLSKKLPELHNAFMYITNTLKVEFNSIYCIYYPEHTDEIKAHRDFEPFISRNSVIAGIVLGNNRTMEFETKPV